MQAMSDPIQFLKEAAQSLGWVETTHSEPSTIYADLTTIMPDGQTVKYALVISREGTPPNSWLAVREQPKHALLPRTCPMRHINDDGSFCIGWGPDHIAWPESGEQANVWWRRLGGYLDLQNRARLTRRWPSQHAWPHGSAAAQAQQDFECISKDLPVSLVQAVKTNSICLGTRSDQIYGRRKACPCGSGHRIKNCHEHVLVALLILKKKVVMFEEMFWEVRRFTVRCCGTMKECPLSE